MDGDDATATPATVADDHDTVAGRCLCGAVRYVVSGPLERAYQCHCGLCRKQGGTASNFAGLVAAERFRWLAGEALIARFRKASGFTAWFCTRCGGTLPNPLRTSAFVWLPLGGLDGTSRPRVVMHLHAASRAAWDVATLAGEVHDEMPSLEEILARLHAAPA